MTKQTVLTEREWKILAELEDERIRLQMSRLEWARRIGISGPALTVRLQGRYKISLGQFEQMAEALGVDLDAILTRRYVLEGAA